VEQRDLVRSEAEWRRIIQTNAEDRGGTIAVFNGPAPAIETRMDLRSGRTRNSAARNPISATDPGLKSVSRLRTDIGGYLTLKPGESTSRGCTYAATPSL
jgi:hypothetical protein